MSYFQKINLDVRNVISSIKTHNHKIFNNIIAVIAPPGEVFKVFDGPKRVPKRKAEPSLENEPSKSPRSETDVPPSEVLMNSDISSTAVDRQISCDTNSDIGISIQDEALNSQMDNVSTAGGVTEEEDDMEIDKDDNKPTVTADKEGSTTDNNTISSSWLFRDSRDDTTGTSSAVNVNDERPFFPIPFVENLFGGKTVQVTHCLKCDVMRDLVENIVDLKVSFLPNEGNAVSVETLIKNSFKTKELVDSNQYFCSACNGKQDAKIHTAIIKAPEFLIVSQNRFMYDGSKNMTPVHIKELLEIPVWKLDDLKTHIISSSNIRYEDSSSGVLAMNAYYNDVPKNSTSLEEDDDESSGLERLPSKLKKVTINQRKSPELNRTRHPSESSFRRHKPPFNPPVSLGLSSDDTGTTYNGTTNTVSTSGVSNLCEEVQYVLYGIVVHAGRTSRAGHYYSYVRGSSAAVASVNNL